MTLKRKSSLTLGAAVIFAGLGNLAFYHPNESAFRVQVDGGAESIVSLRSTFSRLHDARWGQVESDTYWEAIQLLHWVGDAVPPRQGKVGFWYSNSDQISSSAQSVFLWGYSRVQGWYDTGMPVLDNAAKTSIESLRYVVLLGPSPASVDAGLTALRQGGIKFLEVERKSFRGEVINLEAALVERVPSEPVFAGRVVDIPTRLYEARSGYIGPVDNAIGITTADQQWAYSALANLTSMHLESGPITFRLRLHVKSGAVGIAVNEAGNINKLLAEIEVGPTNGPQTVAIPLKDAAKAEYLIVRNRSPRGASEVVVYETAR